MAHRHLAVLVALLVAMAALHEARAEPAAPPAPHKGRLTGFVQLGTGYRGIFPFDEEYCGEDDPDKSYCLGRSPFGLDLGGGFGLTESLDVILTVSLGLEADFGVAPGQDGPRTVALAPGLKLQLTELGGGGVLWSTLELPIDVTSYDQADSVDFGVRNRNALEFPVASNVGLYAFFGESASWRRWFRFELQAGVGVAIRR
jgi:hypothetical protein